MINNRHFHLSRTEREKERGMYMCRCGRKVRERSRKWKLSNKRNRRKGKVNGETHQDARKELMFCAALFECLINTWSNLITNKSLDENGTIPLPSCSFNEHNVTRWLKTNWKWWWQRRSSILLETTRSSKLCKHSEQNFQLKYERA